MWQKLSHTNYLNKIIMKYNLLLLFFFTTSSIVAQISIGPSIGLNQTYMYAKSNNNQFIVENIFEPNPSFGIKSEFFLWNKKAKITLNSNYYHRKVLATKFGFNPLESVDYNSINSALILNKSITSNLYIGLGMHYVHVQSINFNYSNGDTEIYEKKNDFGIVGSINYDFKNFVVDFNYGYSYKTNEFHQNEIEQRFEPITFMQLQLTYLFPLKLANK